MMKNINGFATKRDLKKLEEKINARFIWFREEIKDDLKQFEKETFSKFDSKWTTRIDPILAEIAKHREKEVIFMAQYERIEKLLNKIAAKTDIRID